MFRKINFAIAMCLSFGLVLLSPVSAQGQNVNIPRGEKRGPGVDVGEAIRLAQEDSGGVSPFAVSAGVGAAVGGVIGTIKLISAVKK